MRAKIMFKRPWALTRDTTVIIMCAIPKHKIRSPILVISFYGTQIQSLTTVSQASTLNTQVLVVAT